MPTEAMKIGQAVLRSAKRGRNERTGVHAWHAYYAGFSEDFVESALCFLKCKPGMTVLDPWGGSGTTSLVSSRNGMKSISVDINPAISALSASKSFDVLMHRNELLKFFDEIRDSLLRENVDHIEKINVESTLRLLVNSFLGIFPKLSNNYKENASQFLSDGGRDVFISYPLTAFLQVAAFRVGRKYHGDKASTNPTWIRHRKTLYRDADALSGFEKIGIEMLADLDKAYRGSKGAQSVHVVGDSRKLPIKTGTIDAIITSPPYLTRIDYAVSAAPELSLMNISSSLRDIRLDTMGSPVIRKSLISQKSSWGEKCNVFLNDVASHESKAAKSYYLKHMLQYFDDMEKSLVEIRRVLRRGGKALVIVQGSYFKEIFCPLGELYVEMASGLGLKSEIVFNDKISGRMANLNGRSSKYKANKRYSEDFVQLIKR